MFVLMMCLDLIGFSSFENQTKNGFLSGHLKTFLPEQEEYELREILNRANKNPNDPIAMAIGMGIALIPWGIFVYKRHYGIIRK